LKAHILFKDARRRPGQIIAMCQGELRAGKSCLANMIVLQLTATMGLILLALSSAAEARVFMRNAESCGDSCWTNTIDYQIDQESIADGVYMTLKGQKEIEPPSELGGFALLWGCTRADGSEPSLEVTYRTKPHGVDTPLPTAPNCEKYRLLGIWGRYLGEDALMPQQINDRDVTFSGDLKCSEAHDAPDDEHWFTGDYVWVKKPFTFCVPLGLADIFYVRAEARRADEGSGLAQINFAQNCEQGSSAGGPAMQMRTQVKGASISGEPVSLDNVPIHISQISHEFCTFLGPGSEGIVLASGYRLVPKSYSRPAVIASEAAPGVSAWLLETASELRAKLSGWMARPKN
jgi:hypothetical protein